MYRLADVTIRLNRRGMHQLLNSRRGPIYRMVQRDTEQTQRLAKRSVGSRSGELRRSIRRETSVRPFRFVMGRVFTHSRYGLYVEVGTQGPIRPKHGQYLRFRSTRRGDRGRVYVLKQVQGQPGQRYLTLGLLEAVRAGGSPGYTVDVKGGAPYSGLSHIP